MTADWQHGSFQGEPLSDFTFNGTMESNPLTLAPGQTIEIPKVHMVFFEGKDWTVLDNAQKRYIRDRLAYHCPSDRIRRGDRPQARAASLVG